VIYIVTVEYRLLINRRRRDPASAPGRPRATGLRSRRLSGLPVGCAAAMRDEARRSEVCSCRSCWPPPPWCLWNALGPGQPGCVAAEWV